MELMRSVVSSRVVVLRISEETYKPGGSSVRTTCDSWSSGSPAPIASACATDPTSECFSPGVVSDMGVGVRVRGGCIRPVPSCGGASVEVHAGPAANGLLEATGAGLACGPIVGGASSAHVGAAASDGGAAGPSRHGVRHSLRSCLTGNPREKEPR